MSTRFSVGDIRVDRVIEQEDPLFDPLTFFPALTPDLLAENRAWLREAGALDANDQMVLCIQSYIVRTARHTILIDSCVGNDKPRPGRAFWHMQKKQTYTDGLRAAGVKVEEIDFVLCTHLHVDHVGWNTRLENGRWVPTFPNARYVFSERELAYWTEQHSKTPIECIEDSVLPIVEAKRADLVRSDHALSDDVHLLPTPGHTPDHFAVRIGRGDQGVVMSGDLIHSPLQARYPELSMRADTDQTQSAATRRNFLEQHCDRGIVVCTAHFPSPSMGHVSRWDNGYRFKPLAS